MKRSIIVFVGLAAIHGAGQCAGDPVLGERQYARCTSCHNLGPAPRAKIGPNLKGVFGKPAATVDAAYKYSKPLRDAKLVWTDKALDAFLKSPTTVVPGNTMTFVGITNDDVRANIVAFLKQK